MSVQYTTSYHLNIEIMYYIGTYIDVYRTNLWYIRSGLFSIRSFKLRKVESFFISSGSCFHARTVLGVS